MRMYARYAERQRWPVEILSESPGEHGGYKEVIARIQNTYGIEAGGTTADRRFSLEAVRCLGACGLAPVITINDQVHQRVKPARIPELLQSYASDAQPAEVNS